MRARNPEARLRAFLALCGGKRVCEHTGGPQPQYRMDGMRIMAEFPKPKDDDAAESVADVERKQEVRPRACPAARAWRSQPAGRPACTCARRGGLSHSKGKSARGGLGKRRARPNNTLAGCGPRRAQVPGGGAGCLAARLNCSTGWLCCEERCNQSQA